MYEVFQYNHPFFWVSLCASAPGMCLILFWVSFCVCMNSSEEFDCNVEIWGKFEFLIAFYGFYVVYDVVESFMGKIVQWSSDPFCVCLTSSKWFDCDVENLGKIMSLIEIFYFHKVLGTRLVLKVERNWDPGIVCGVSLMIGKKVVFFPLSFVVYLEKDANLLNDYGVRELVEDLCVGSIITAPVIISIFEDSIANKKEDRSIYAVGFCQCISSCYGCNPPSIWSFEFHYVFVWIWATSRIIVLKVEENLSF